MSGNSGKKISFNNVLKAWNDVTRCLVLSSWQSKSKEPQMINLHMFF